MIGGTPVSRRVLSLSAAAVLLAAAPAIASQSGPPLPQAGPVAPGPMPTPASVADAAARSSTFTYEMALRSAVVLGGQKLAQQAATILAKDANDTPSYLRLVSYAARAGDTRTADLAGQKAVDLAPKDQKKLIEKQIEALKKASQAQPPSG